MAIVSPPPLRIEQVASYFSRDGAFGGPVAVAVAQSGALAALGNDVQLRAGWDGRGLLNIAGVRLHLHLAFRGRLPLTAVLPPTLALGLRARRHRLDVVHVHFGRDLVSALAVLALKGFRGVLVLQPHGMVMPDRRPLARVMDALIVRPAFARADAVLALTDAEKAGLVAVCRGRALVERIGNGIEVAPDAATGRSGTPRVLFLARLHPRKNATLFVEAALKLVAEGIAAEFLVAGPDEGELSRIADLLVMAGSPAGIRYVGAVPPAETRELLRTASLYVLPSVGEVFPMTVLEALAVGTPVVVTSENGLAGELIQAGAALVIEPTADALAEAIRDVIEDNTARIALAERGLAAVRERFSSRAVAERLVEIYRRVPRRS